MVEIEVGFIEKAGTGIWRMREDAKRHRYPEPKFTANGFFTALSDQVPYKYRPSTVQVTPQVAIMLIGARVPRTRDELQRLGGFKNRAHFIKGYLGPMLAARWLEMTIPEKPRSSKQRYRTTALGLNALNRKRRKG